jgi:large subunit ribosomal protein L24
LKKKPTEKMKIKLKQGDNVQIIAGASKGQKGKILKVDRKAGRVIVEGVNLITKHQKPNKANQTGGRIKKEAPIHVSNVMFLHQGKPTRIGCKIEVLDHDGVKEIQKSRIAVSTGETID